MQSEENAEALTVITTITRAQFLLKPDGRLLGLFLLQVN